MATPGIWVATVGCLDGGWLRLDETKGWRSGDRRRWWAAGGGKAKRRGFGLRPTSCVAWRAGSENDPRSEEARAPALFPSGSPSRLSGCGA